MNKFDEYEDSGKQSIGDKALVWVVTLAIVAALVLFGVALYVLGG